MFNNLFIFNSKNVPKAAVFVCLLLILGSIASYFTYNIRLKEHQIYKIFHGAINADVLIVGSSRAQYHIDPVLIEARTGLKSYNIGISGGGSSHQLFILEQYLKHNKVPKHIIINVEYQNLQENLFANKFDINMYELFLVEKDIFKLYSKQRLSRLIYLMIFPFEANDFFLFIPKDTSNGSRTFDRKYQDNEGLTTRSFTVYPDKESINLSKELIMLAKRNSQVTVVYSPELKLINNEREVIDALNIIMSDEQVKFYNHKHYLADTKYFFDAYHLNKIGRAKYTDNLIKLIFNK